MAELVKASLTKAQLYWRTAPTFLLIVVWTRIFRSRWGDDGGLSDRLGSGYLPTVLPHP